jgi:arylsulfatase
MVKEVDRPEFPIHLDRHHLPEPDWTFPNARIGMYATESTPDFPPSETGPEGFAEHPAGAARRRGLRLA